MPESKVRLNVEGTGPDVSTIKITSPTSVDAAGAAVADTAKHQQIVTAADRRGDFGDDVDLDILNELRAIRGVLDLIAMKLS